MDASGAQVNGSFLTGNNINDKGLSFGENSNGEIINIGTGKDYNINIIELI